MRSVPVPLSDQATLWTLSKVQVVTSLLTTSKNEFIGEHADKRPWLSLSALVLFVPPVVVDGTNFGSRYAECGELRRRPPTLSQPTASCVFLNPITSAVTLSYASLSSRWTINPDFDIAVLSLYFAADDND